MNFRQLSIVTSQLAFLIVFGTQIAFASETVDSCTDSAQEYWKIFRVAALRNNLPLVADLSRFPFEFRGTLDDSERRRILREDFIKLFPKFLKTDPGLTPIPTTMKSLLKGTARLSPSFCNSYGTQFRVGTWVFERDSDGWRFVQAFVDD